MFFSYTNSKDLSYKGGDFVSGHMIKNPPEYLPLIRLVPFADELEFKGIRRAQAFKKVAGIFGPDYTILPRGMHAIYLALKEAGIKKGDHIAVVTTFGNRYLSGCVRHAVESVGKLKRKITVDTKAVVIVHEWGIFCKETEDIIRYCRKKRIVVIEDCAMLMRSFPKLKSGRGLYKVYSFTKIFPMQFGGALLGKVLPERLLKNEGMFDSKKRSLVIRQLGAILDSMPKIAGQRRRNWKYLNEFFGKKGLSTYYKPGSKDVPHAYLLKLSKSDVGLRDFKMRLYKFGIECAPYWGNGAVALPCHQELNKAHLDYILAAVMSILNQKKGKR